MISLEFTGPGFHHIEIGWLMKTCCIRFFVLTVLLSLLSSLAAAQQTPLPSVSQVVVEHKSGKEAVCDGALEIIPSGQVTFPRKRYVAANPKGKSKLAKPRSNGRR